MLTIGQLASYAGATIRAVRHYHQIGLLPEPERDASGYRTYGADAVVRLIRIRTLAEAGVPLARVQELLDADLETFAEATSRIDRELRRQIRELQEHRRRIAQLASGDSLAVPQEVLDYLDQLRNAGVPEEMIEAERDAWILVAARWPEQIPAIMADKTAQLSDPKVARLYQLIGQLLGADSDAQEQVIEDMADLLVEMYEQADASGQLDQQEVQMNDATFVGLLDSMAADSHPLFPRLTELIAERGWTGWTRIERG
ncbi:MerR family transcriptional regulator [Nocardioides sp.]|uniref:MerR family transcriptional regulator n=1 Tax=Nocardioides sp. TaxID=35761 RepID=UPI002735A8B1|nr:MerR family transcriptional regulator [Nocardioides sp.]MDP3892960.1 MerR family transcriptional regulator [Nocardioides sp.]